MIRMGKGKMESKKYHLTAMQISRKRRRPQVLIQRIKKLIVALEKEVTYHKAWIRGSHD